jgi:hypothetical protein
MAGEPNKYGSVRERLDQIRIIVSARDEREAELFRLLSEAEGRVISVADAWEALQTAQRDVEYLLKQEMRSRLAS